jgi:hypothetical protein
LAIARVVIAAAEPGRTAGLFAALFGSDSVGERDGLCTLDAGTARIELMPRARIAEEFGAAAPEPAGRADYLAVLGLKVASLDAAAALLRAVPGIAVEPGRVIVPARAAFNTTLLFGV